MPPANTPLESGSPADSTRETSPASFRSVLRVLTSPVPDYASTLGLQAEDDVVADNISFLRRPLDIMDGRDRHAPHEDRRSVRSAGSSSIAQRRDVHLEGEEQIERRYQAHREALVRQRRESQEAFAASMRDRTGPAYGDRIPSHQSLYDWAPGTFEGGNADDEEMQRLVAEIRQVQPNTHEEIVRALARAQLETQRHGNIDRAVPGRPGGQQDLRSAAILQSVSRNWRFSHRSRNLMSQYIIDRERALLSAQGDEANVSSRSRQSGESLSENFRQSHNRSPWPGAATPTDSPSTLDREAVTLDSLRRRYLENPSTKVTEFERIIKYLHGLRSSDSGPGICPESLEGSNYEASTTLSMDQEAIRKMQGGRPYPSSWLSPGMTFEGQQEATPLQNTTLYRLSSSTHHDGPSPRPSSLAASEAWFGNTLTASPEPASAKSPPDSWTVKVAIHSVDYDSMTLQGTMEAFNVPSYPSTMPPSPATRTSDSATSKTTFSTYLTGELIDFTTHTLLTESEKRFAAETTANVDAEYWRKLEPFSGMSDEEIARALMDKKWIQRQIMEKYILMRWKERSFVRPTYTTFSHRGDVSSLSSTTTPSSRRPAASTAIAATSSTRTATSPRSPLPPPSATTSYVHADGQRYGLSISGFYYVSLRRSDGHCEGLYRDPHSTPFQRLKLRPMCGGLFGGGAWEVR